ncbi:NAD(P)-binding protein [Pseudovirgaria hyperparasitica]|uniref:NAD(P)-binding protein n=1 Tax=Pseudovirgaria hyperparasitica TaxID=470096 RepID=A0A6A6W8H3_9PEZI|nr:NAD(P)-binding protein [Pseudovirgaria hyperparasitica]KAF2758509.1 NAD(P)-binding protein [Pseudovirgaria hyperparasitica]
MSHLRRRRISGTSPALLPTGLASFVQVDVEGHLFDDNGLWREAPVFKGTTKFDPLPDMKNILVTGGAGFIASWVVRHLTLTYPDDYNIVCYDKLDYCASMSNIRSLGTSNNFRFVHGDITNPSTVRACLVEHKIDTILHFAAQSHVDLSFGNSYEFTNTNVFGTHVLLESAREVGLKRFVHISTDEVYGEVSDDEEGLIENTILAPTNPYAASKAAAEMLVNGYWKSFKLPVMIIRSNNVYGPHQYPEKVIPKFTCLLNRQQKLLLHGDGKHARKYLYAGDACDAFDTILHKGTMGQVYNIPSNDEISNLNLCSQLLDYFGYPNSTSSEFYMCVQHTQDRPFNDRRYAVDGSKLKQLGWSQKTSWEEGFKTTVGWYIKYGETWWGDIEGVFTAFPTITEGDVSTVENVYERPERLGSIDIGRLNGVIPEEPRAEDASDTPVHEAIEDITPMPLPEAAHNTQGFAL